MRNKKVASLGLATFKSSSTWEPILVAHEHLRKGVLHSRFNDKIFATYKALEGQQDVPNHPLDRLPRGCAHHIIQRTVMVHLAGKNPHTATQLGDDRKRSTCLTPVTRPERTRDRMIKIVPVLIGEATQCIENISQFTCDIGDGFVRPLLFVATPMVYFPRKLTRLLDKSPDDGKL